MGRKKEKGLIVSGLHTLTRAIEAIEDQRAKIQKKVEQDIKRLNEQIRAITDEVVLGIQKGESTGDRFLDYVFISPRLRPRSEDAKRYRDIDAALKERQGQQVLLHYSREERIGPIHMHSSVRGVVDPDEIMGSRSRHILVAYFKLGILYGGDLLLSLMSTEPYCALSVHEYVVKDPLCNKPKIEEGFITSKGNSLLDPNREWFLEGAPLPQGASEDIVSRVIVGDDAVRAWFAERDNLEEYKRVIALLKKDPFDDIPD